MKKRERMLALERFVGTALANGERERRRTDEVVVRTARLERYTQDLESALERQLLSNVDRDDRIADLEAGLMALSKLAPMHQADRRNEEVEAVLFRLGERVDAQDGIIMALKVRVAELERRLAVYDAHPSLALSRMGYHDVDDFYKEDAPDSGEASDHAVVNHDGLSHSCTPMSGDTHNHTVVTTWTSCPCCGKSMPVGAKHSCSDGMWWYDDGEKAAYTVTAEER